MSTCVSAQGEFGSHQLADAGDGRFLCSRCFVLDEDALFDALHAAEAAALPPGDTALAKTLRDVRDAWAAEDAGDWHYIHGPAGDNLDPAKASPAIAQMLTAIINDLDALLSDAHPDDPRPYCLRCEVPIYQDDDGVWRREATGSQVCPRNPAVDGHEPRVQVQREAAALPFAPAPAGAVAEDEAVEALARVLHDVTCIVNCDYAVDEYDLEGARYILASDWLAEQAREREAKVLREAKARISDAAPLNMELRHDGTTDPIAAAYVEGLGDAHEIVQEMLADRIEPAQSPEVTP